MCGVNGLYYYYYGYIYIIYMGSAVSGHIHIIYIIYYIHISGVVDYIYIYVNRPSLQARKSGLVHIGLGLFK